jgi:hypothetical protein
MKSRGPIDETTLASPSKFMMSSGMNRYQDFKTPNKADFSGLDFNSPD